MKKEEETISISFNYQKAVLIVNPVAGKGKVKKEFEKNAFPKIKKKMNSELKVVYTKEIGHATKIAENFLNDDYDYIISVGGDGTNNEVLNGIMNFKNNNELHHDFIFGFLPLGTGCDFIRTFGMKSEEIDKNIDILVNANAIFTDIGLSESYSTIIKDKKIKKYFLNELSIGSSAEIMNNVNNSSMIINHDLTYMYHIFATSLMGKNISIQYKLNDGEFSDPIVTYMLCIDNGQFFGSNLWVNPDGLIDDGKFEVTDLGDLTFLEILSSFSSIQKGTHHKDVTKVKKLEKITEMEIKAGKDQMKDVLLVVDGDLSGKCPCKISCLSKEIKIVVPKNFSYPRRK